MEHSEKFEVLAAALVEAQAEILGAIKDKQNPHLKSKYADLSSVMDACKPALNRHGIAIIQTPAPCDGKVAVETMLLHKSGQWVSGRVEIPMVKADPQGYGSAMTYARRYSLAAMAGVCPEDDDGEGAMSRGQQQRQPQQQQRPPQRQQPAPQQQPARQEPHDASEPDDAEQATIRLSDLIMTASKPAETERAILAKEGVDGIGRLPPDRVAYWTEFLAAKVNGKGKKQPATAGAT